MSKRQKWSVSETGDAFAIKLQSLRSEGKVNDEQPLIKLDYRDQGAKAPFQFDVAKATVHRTRCSAIPQSSRYALYALWDLKDTDKRLACKRCRPESVKMNDIKKDETSDIMYGFLSILDQFGSVLAERGKEYRNSSHGRQVSNTIDNLVGELDNQQKEGLKFALSSIDGLIRIIHGYNDTIQDKSNGNGRSRNGNNGGHKGPKGNGQGTKAGGRKPGRKNR